MQCRSFAGQLGRKYQDFQALNCQILIILGDTSDRARRYAESLHLPFPVLSDPQRSVYHEYGLEKAFFGIQRTATVIVDKSGIVRFVRQVINPMTWLSEVQEVLSAAQEISRTNLDGKK